MIDEKNIRILYMGTPEMSAKTLESLILAGFNIVGVIAQEDKEVGRKRILEKVPTKVVAEKYNIPVYQPHRIRLDYEFVKKINPDLILTFAYGQIIPTGLLEIPPYGCLNLHGSILPKYRGAAPIQHALLNGDKETGITLMEMVDKMDAGKMFAFEKVEILEEDNYSSLCSKLSDAATRLAIRELPNYLNDKLPGEEQDESQVTIAGKIKPEDEKLDINATTDEFMNKVRALSYVPGAYIYVDGLKLKIFKVKKTDLETSKVGELIINKRTFLSLSDGVIELLEVQLEGKNMVDTKSFANGYKKYNGIIAQ